MRIAINFAAIRSAGTRTYASGFLPAFAACAEKHCLLVFASRTTQKLVGDIGPNVEWADTSWFDTAMSRFVWEQVALPRQLAWWRSDVLFAPFDIAPLLSPCPVVLAVRNPMPTIQASSMRERAAPPGRALLQYAITRMSCRRARSVFYPTAFAATLLGDAMSVPTVKRSVVFHGTDNAFWAGRADAQSLEPFDLIPGRYVLFVSRLYPQKNPGLLVRAYARWRERCKRTNWRLAFAGSHVSSQSERDLRQLSRDLGIESEIAFLGEVAREALPSLYRHAAVFVLPTEMETFGHPFVEAMASGVPVVAADTVFARELCGDAAEYFPPGDVDALAATLDRIVSDPMAAASMRDRGLTQARQFSWQREATETLALLEQTGVRS